MHAVPQPQQQQQVPSQLQQGGDGMDVDGAGGDVSRRESEGGLVPAGGATRANSGSSTGGTQGAGGAGADAAGGFDVSASLFRWPTEEGPRGTDGRTKLICRVSSLPIGSGPVHQTQAMAEPAAHRAHRHHRHGAVTFE